MNIRDITGDEKVELLYGKEVFRWRMKINRVAFELMRKGKLDCEHLSGIQGDYIAEARLPCELFRYFDDERR